MSNLAFLTRSSLLVLDKVKTGMFSISEVLVKSLINKNIITSKPVIILTNKKLEELRKPEKTFKNLRKVPLQSNV